MAPDARKPCKSGRTSTHLKLDEICSTRLGTGVDRVFDAATRKVRRLPSPGSRRASKNSGGYGLGMSGDRASTADSRSAEDLDQQVMLVWRCGIGPFQRRE